MAAYLNVHIDFFILTSMKWKKSAVSFYNLIVPRLFEEKRRDIVFGFP